MEFPRDRDLLPRRPPSTARPDTEAPTLQVERFRQALQVLERAPHLSGDARRRGTRVLEAACQRLRRSSRP